jgi:hypothetical protein
VYTTASEQQLLGAAAASTDAVGKGSRRLKAGVLPSRVGMGICGIVAAVTAVVIACAW